MALKLFSSQLMVLVPNGSMEYDVAATAWNRKPGRYGTGRLLGCRDYGGDVYTALEAFKQANRGKGQLAAGLPELEELRELGTTVVSLAKRIEEVFVPGRSQPIVLGHDTPALQLLQRVRDEAHRFAIEHHRSRRDKAMTRSVLDDIPGVGPTRKRAILNHFGTPEQVLAASREELEGVPGLPGKVAREIHQHLHRVD